MDSTTRALVRQRAKGYCEYCQLHQSDSDYQPFHIEHIVPKQHGGSDEEGNLCLACSECNWAKGPNLAGLLSGKLVALFHPRKQRWHRHFAWHGTILVGKTTVGTVTVQVLDVNASHRVLLRENLALEGRFPPQI
jgi:hypothetical protein